MENGNTDSNANTTKASEGTLVAERGGKGGSTSGSSSSGSSGSSGGSCVKGGADNCCSGAYPYYSTTKHVCFAHSNCTDGGICTPSACCNGTGSCANKICYADAVCDTACEGSPEIPMGIFSALGASLMLGLLAAVLWRKQRPALR